ncbi:flagellar biosynthesis protein FlgN [Bradyrhizobium sp. GCM10027634]|uniref:flagellar biosynthesis protein FlgN n=1 Tax=unclassified Bradyrhizobium TaxID=2631580 RepID=UPI00188AC0C1|nr:MULTISPECIES: flagellar biosynthesis protein FlgN [unclassified Bradyrhizobium]MDN4999792.1 flagellar biosynthesis protein FlgN [Bradyrhizobium sp. WYCCWR 12677]QOZ43307.1 flagellar biosynthesis protein FlgN [Bradyrhizobium sp. CCBAU 53340]
MQVEQSATAPAMEQPVMDTEAMTEAAPGDALLPALLLDIGAVMITDDAEAARLEATRSEEISGLLAAIRRLEGIVEEETTALAMGQKVDFDDFSARKSRSMLEFVRLMRARMHLGVETEITEEIQRLREKLERNRSLLEMHYDAVREVATIIVKAIKDAESDGTYTGRAARDGK